jgi:hypothetical protein
MAWLCQCGSGSLCGGPPPVCPLCGFDFELHFGPLDDEEEEAEEEEAIPRCQVCGEETTHNRESSWFGHVHRFGPRDHDFTSEKEDSECD